jgi:hypothetical protein
MATAANRVGAARAAQPDASGRGFQEISLRELPRLKLGSNAKLLGSKWQLSSYGNRPVADVCLFRGELPDVRIQAVMQD